MTDQRHEHSGKKLGDKSELLSKEEMDKLLDSVAGNLYFTTLYKFLRYSGIRIGEIYGTYRTKKLVGGVQVSDVDFDNNQITSYVLKLKKRKSKVVCPNCNTRIKIKSKFCDECGFKLPEQEIIKYEEPEKCLIEMMPQYKEVLRSYITSNKLKPKDYLFREYSLIYLKKLVKVHAKQAGITKNFSLHGFRHYFVTRCKLQGFSNDKIAQWTHHKNPNTLNIYTHVVPKDVAKEFREVDL
jgi:integrase